METWKFSKIDFVAFATNIVAISNEPYYIDTVFSLGPPEANATKT
jgi:hypothetical protein